MRIPIEADGSYSLRINTEPPMRSTAAFLAPLALLAVACGTPPPAVDLLGDDERPTARGHCPGNVCLVDPDATAREEARTALAACVPSGELSAAGGGELRLSRIELVVDDDGAAALHVALANIGATDALDYPGLNIEVVTGDARFGGDFGSGATGGTQLYGVLACTEFEVVLPLSWETEEEGFAAATVSVSALNQLGDVEADAAVVELRRGAL